MGTIKQDSDNIEEQIMTTMDSSRCIVPTSKSVIQRLLLPLAALVALMTAGVVAYQWQQHQQKILDSARILTAETNRDLLNALEQQALGLAITAKLIASNPTVQRDLRERDAEALLVSFQPVFETLRRENNLTHFYFFDTNRNCLLRVHKPDKSGDFINRGTAIEAERTRKTATGLELGPLGTFTLRVVQPVFEGEKLVGYVELGKEIEDVLQAITNHVAIELAVVISKRNLNQHNWEDGMHMLGRASNWDFLPNDAVIYATPGVPPGALNFMFDCNAGTYSRICGNFVRSLTNWQVSATPLKDASGNEVGCLLIMNDNTADKASFARFMTFSVAAGGAMLALIVAIIYALLRRTDVYIRKQQQILTDSEQSYRAQFYDNSSIMLLVDPKDGAILGANIAAEIFYGYSEKQLLAMRITQINTLQESELLQIISSIKHGSGCIFDFKHRLEDGSIRDVQVSSSIILFGDRRILHSIIYDITDRKRLESVILESEVKYRLLFEGSRDAMMLLSPPEWTFFDCNKQTLQLFGITSIAEFEALRPRDLSPEHQSDGRLSAEKAKEMIAIALHVGSHFFEWEHKRLNGATFHTDVLLTKIEATGKILLKATVRDITDRKKSENIFKSEHQRLNNILEGTQAGTWEWNIQTGETTFNEKWAQIVGYTLEELAPVSINTWLALAHPDDMKHSGLLLEKHFSGELPYYDCECRMKHKDGHWVWVHDRGKIVTFSDSGKPLMMFGTHQDITDRKYTDAALEESEELYRTFFASFDAIKLIINPDTGAIKDANPAAVEFYGYDLDQLKGMFIYEINMLPKENVLSELSKAFLSKTKHFYFRHRLASGEFRDVEAYTSPIVYEKENLIMSSIHDVSELRRLEQIKEDVEGIIRHDLRAPLSGIINIPALLKDDENLTPDQRHMLMMIESSGKKMLSQINSSLELYKIESGTYRLNAKVCDPLKLVRESTNLLTNSLRVNPELVIIREHSAQTGERILKLKTDELLLDIILMNLLRNALEASDPGEQMFIDLSEDGENFTITISNARPVPMEIRETFFEKFATAGKQHGTGLGTYSAAIMTRAIGGTIEMETMEETGTRVTVRIPIAV